jgi:hypothetical protein
MAKRASTGVSTMFAASVNQTPGFSPSATQASLNAGQRASLP